MLDNNLDTQKAETLTETCMLLSKGLALHYTLTKACTFFSECSRIQAAGRNVSSIEPYIDST